MIGAIERAAPGFVEPKVVTSLDALLDEIVASVDQSKLERLRDLREQHRLAARSIDDATARLATAKAEQAEAQAAAQAESLAAAEEFMATGNDADCPSQARADRLGNVIAGLADLIAAKTSAANAMHNRACILQDEIETDLHAEAAKRFERAAGAIRDLWVVNSATHRLVYDGRAPNPGWHRLEVPEALGGSVKGSQGLLVATMALLPKVAGAEARLKEVLL